MLLQHPALQLCSWLQPCLLDFYPHHYHIFVFVQIVKCIFQIVKCICPNCKIICPNCKMYLSKLSTVFVTILKCDCPNCKTYLSKLQHVLLPMDFHPPHYHIFSHQLIKSQLENLTRMLQEILQQKTVWLAIFTVASSLPNSKDLYLSFAIW